MRNAAAPHQRLTPDRSKRIRIFRNGDAHFKGITVEIYSKSFEFQKIVVNARQRHDINAFLDAVSEKIGLVLGAKRLFTLDGQPVTSTEQLGHNEEYVASSGPFTPLPYGQSQSVRSTPSAGRRGSASATGSRFARPGADPFTLSNASSKKSAPASLGVHPGLRQSRSIEPRRGPRATAGEVLSNSRPREKSTGADARRKPSKEAKKRGKKKSKEVPPPAIVPTPVEEPHFEEPEIEEPKVEEEEEVVGHDEEEHHHSPTERNRTEVEVVEHSEHGEEEEDHQEEAEEEAKEVDEQEEAEAEHQHDDVSAENHHHEHEEELAATPNPEEHEEEEEVEHKPKEDDEHKEAEKD